MIRGNASAEEPAEHVSFTRRSNRRRPRRQRPRGLQRSKSCELVSGGGHLRTQPVEDGQCSFLCALGKIASRADAGGTTLLARACGDEFAGFLHHELVRSKERFRKADAAGIRVVQVKI